jgi:hypothetical protein
MIFALTYVVAVFFSHIGAISSEIGFAHYSHRTKQAEVVRTASETNFILSDYGLWFEPRKLGRKERLALAFTNLAETGQ